jgi:hypothetical protein
MGQCDAQTDDSPSGVVPTLDQSTTRLFKPGITTKKEPPLQPTLRGLELIKSSAKFYDNGVGAAKPTVQLSHTVGPTLNQPATRQTSPSRFSKAPISTVAVVCSFFLVLPSLALATIVWWGITIGAAGGPELTGDSSAVSVQLASQAITPPRNLPPATTKQSVAITQSGIIIHKVKTQPIAVDAGGARPR